MSTPVPPRVTIAQGDLEGVWRGASAAFLGIPFAEPPVGELKFLGPVAARRWQGIRPATAYGPTAQRRPFGAVTTIPEPSIPGEDILTVNVFTPQPTRAGTGLPVLVWIHGGGFKAGSPASPWYDGAAFNRDGVVTVTIGYRLGFDGFGWVDDAPLNRGVLDWIAALQWVRDNIAAFGGDPGRVTIAGQSAGGGAVLALLACPAAGGLFQGAIAHSAAFRGADPARAEWLGRRMAHLAGVDPFRESLAAVDEERLLDLQDEVESSLNPPLRSTDEVVAALSGDAARGLPFTPVGDGELLPRTFGEGAALTAHVPLLIGTVEHEFTQGGRELARALDDTGPSEVLHRLLDGFEDDYAAAHPELSPAGLLGQLTTDEMFRIPTVDASEARLPNTWLYDFRHHGPSGMALHCSELPFVFDCLDAEKVPAACGPNPPASLAETMHADWVRFVTTGSPGWEPLSEGGFPTRIYGGPGGDAVDGPGYDTERRLREVLSAAVS
ncbi:MAG TPA: carboxylesterase family protein [Propionibacteriaceae bacterium]|nr:carboxylesterase family protein [Propionibacteriaceae bacterium]